MINHTGAVGACQPLESDATPKTPPPHADRRLLARYGAAALNDGYVAIPRVVIRRRHALDVTTAEWDYICEVWSYWRSDRLPGPSVEDLACGLGVDPSTIRRHRASLERKGLLRVVTVGPYNRYDLRPLIDAAVGLDHTQSDLQDPLADTSPAASPPRPCNSSPNDRAELHATKEVEKKLDYDSISPYPPLHSNTSSHATLPLDEEPQLLVTDPKAANDQVLAASITTLSAEMGDDAPVSSVTRASNLRCAMGVSPDRFLELLDEAATRTRARQATIVKRQRDGQTSNGMPYLFAVLQDLARPAPPRSRQIGPDQECRRTSLPGRRRRRGEPTHEARDAHTSSYGHYPEPPSDTVPVPWRATMNELRGEFTAENYQRWILPTRVLTQDGGVLRIAVADLFDRQWLDRRLRGVIERAMGRVAPGWRIEFVAEQVA